MACEELKVGFAQLLGLQSQRGAKSKIGQACAHHHLAVSPESDAEGSDSRESRRSRGLPHDQGADGARQAEEWYSTLWLANELPRNEGRAQSGSRGPLEAPPQSRAGTTF